MAAQVLAARTRGVVTARELKGSAQDAASGGGWGLDALAGRFVEIADTPAGAALTATAGLIAETQRRGEFAAWIGGLRSIFFPPDFAASGVDLGALPVVCAADATTASQAADILLRSGSFALLVLDLKSTAELPLASQTRLVGLAQKHRTALLCLTRADRRAAVALRGSFVSLRMETDKKRAGHDCFAYALRAVKDKCRTPGWTHREVCRGTDGLC